MEFVGSLQQLVQSVTQQSWLLEQLLWDPVVQVLDTRVRLEFPANALGAHSFHPLAVKLEYKIRIQVHKPGIIKTLQPQLKHTAF